MSGTVWLMDSDFCGTCGCLLDYFESDLCTDCLEDAMYDEEQDRFSDDGFTIDFDSLGRYIGG